MTNLQNENVLSYEETQAILKTFLPECERFWEREKQNYPHNYTEEIDVNKNALQDILNLRNNPYSPNGKQIDPIAKADFIKSHEIYSKINLSGEKAKIGDSIKLTEANNQNVYVVTGRYFESGTEDVGITYLDENNEEYTSYDGGYEIVAYAKK